MPVQDLPRRSSDRWLSPAVGFIHTGKQLSFVYDIADLYKADITIPLAFDLVAEGDVNDLERRARMRCRDAFHRLRLLETILPDIREVLDVGDDGGEVAGELEGTAESLAGGGSIGGLPGDPSSRIREILWRTAIHRNHGGYSVQIWSDHSPQGFSCRTFGKSKAELVDFEGLCLVRRFGPSDDGEPDPEVGIGPGGDR